MRLLQYLALVAMVSSGMAQQAPAKDAIGSSQALLNAWNEVGQKLITMAEDFPENKYDFKPTPAQKTFGEQLMHVARANDYFMQALQGHEPKNDEASEKVKGKTEVVAYIKKSFADGAGIITEKGDSGMTQMLADPESGERMPLISMAYEAVEHSGEHYGQLVVYYRVAGLVPPESRPKK
jgi:uncharacterized damage-inducible protein DinB